MHDVADVERRIANLQAIREIVHSMWALSAVQYRRGSETLENLRTYTDHLRRGLAWLRSSILSAYEPQRIIVVVLGSDQGLCGPLTARLVQRATSRLRDLGDRAGGCLALGKRTRELLVRAGFQPLDTRRAPVSIDGVDTAVEWIARRTDTLVSEAGIDGVEVAYAHARGVGSYEPSVARVFPVDGASLRTPSSVGQ